MLWCQDPRSFRTIVELSLSRGGVGNTELSEVIMTSNQVAYAQVREDVRHNEAVEAETTRHNTKTEELQDALNAINQEANNWKKAYEQRRNDIQEEYNRALIRMQTAQGDEKNRISAELNLINDRKYTNEADYYRKANEINQYRASIESDVRKENERHNEATEAIEVYRIDQANFLKNKELTLNKERYEREFELGLLSNEIQKERNTINIYDVLAKQDYNMKMLGLAESKLPSEKAALEAQARLQGVQATTAPVTSFGQMLFGKHGLLNIATTLIK